MRRRRERGFRIWSWTRSMTSIFMSFMSSSRAISFSVSFYMRPRSSGARSRSMRSMVPSFFRTRSSWRPISFFFFFWLFIFHPLFTPISISIFTFGFSYSFSFISFNDYVVFFYAIYFMQQKQINFMQIIQAV
jgi:hypothetical protein